ncbi:MAG: RdgB/HAM1 family non-canonical purine NTP pyrophosphatase [Polyangiaceae bacterium]|nr:RdgB/HAM1 family non-canonical purine NTP pyrophosphatase [Polyangiaceae bacterium]
MSESRALLVVATSNKGKLAEYRELFAGLPVRILSVSDVLGREVDVVEDGDTYAENARKKAVAVAGATGLLTLADDSGLEVDLLGGGPGVRSARYAGDGATSSERVEKLLRELGNASIGNRAARFRCVICVVDPRFGREDVFYANGDCEGFIGISPRGTGGFGYDPVFFVAGFDRTMAELSSEEKGEVSHRGRAARAIRPDLERLAKLMI